MSAQGKFRGVWYACGHLVNTLPGHEYVYSGPMATYCVWHRPMAVYCPETDTTYFVYGAEGNSPAISAYDHAAGAFADPVILGSNHDGDAHRNPTLLVDREGYLYVYYGAHNDPSIGLRSEAPYDITRWRRVADIEDPGGSYPQVWQLLPDELFVTFRHAPGWRCRMSRDSGESWEPPVQLVHFPPDEKGPRENMSVYGISVAATGDFPRRVHFTWSRLGGGTPEEKATKDLWARRYNVYYACSDDGGYTWRRSDGTPYDLPITEDTAEMLYDCGEHGVWLKDIQLDPEGNPYILFLDSDVATYASTWKVARRVDNGWAISDVATSDHMYDDGGLVVMGPGDVRVYGPTTPVQPHHDGGEIEEWTSRDGGETWTNTRHLTAGSRYSHNCIKVVHGHEAGGGDLRILWSYGDSIYPPETEEVRLYACGEAWPGAHLLD